jgi:hypothetical protein
MDVLKLANSFTYYLPQFHVIPENEKWWGAGFTEWTKLRDAKSYANAQVIQTPGELGWYDLNNVEVIGQQHKLARDNGVGTFAFWHYWFGDNDLLLEKPMERLFDSDVVADYCVAWANHDWLKRSTGETLRAQSYDKDAGPHFGYLERFFHDPRYRKVDNRPVMFIFSPGRHPYLEEYVHDMHRRAQASGFDGIYFVFDHTGPQEARAALCDRVLNSTAPLKFETRAQKILARLQEAMGKQLEGPRQAQYSACVDHVRRMKFPSSKQIPVAFPGWDTSIRHAERGQILLKNTPELYGSMLDWIRDQLAPREEADRMVVFKSWNEWAEGNILEPSAEFGRAYLEQTAARFRVN